MFIYVIVCDESLKLYVGQHKGEDLGKYLSRKFWDANHHTSGKRSHLYAAMRKYPRECWSIHPLVSDVGTRNELDILERHYIKVLKCQHPRIGYNICDGGEGFTGHHTKAVCQKMSAKIKASYVRRGAAEIQKRSEQVKARWANPEFRKRVSEAIKAAPNSGQFRTGNHEPRPKPLGFRTSTSFAAGHLPWNTGTKGKVKPNSGSFQRKG
jgi:hypothetical protein